MQEGAQQGLNIPWEAAGMRSIPWLLSLISQAPFLMGVTVVVLTQPKQGQCLPGPQPLTEAAELWPALCLTPLDLQAASIVGCKVSSL